MKVCPKCKTQLEDDELFCHECGAKQEIEDVEVKPEEQSVEEKFCVHCGKAIEADSMFCPYCGKPQDVEETKSEEPQSKAEETEREQEKPQKEKPETKKNPKPHTTSEKREKLIAENALEKSILSMIDAHIKRFQEEEGKTVKSILKPQSYPNANIQLFSDANRQFVLKVDINESIEGEKELYERLKDSKFFKMFVKEGSDSNENSLILDFHNDKDQAKNTILDLLVTIYNQPKECSIGYVTNVSGYTLQDKGIEKSETSSGCGCWIWILLGVILLGIIGAGYYFLTQTDDTPKTEENDVKIATSQDEAAHPSDPKEFLNSLYNDFYEQGNTDRFDEAVLSKYFTKGAMRKFYVEDSYEEGHYFYCTDFLTHGTISGGPDPDYGDKIVYRLIVTENDGWFKVTNIWDVIKEPVIVHLQVKTIDGALKIVDVKAKNLDESEAEETAQERISFEDALVVVKEMIIEKNGSFVGFQSPEKVENIMAKYGYKKRKRYFVYRALNLEPLYYKNCSFEETTEDDYEYSEVPSAGKGGTPSFVGIDASNVVVELFTKDALDDFLNQMKESGASLKEENKDQNFSHYELDPYEITVYTSLAWGFHYCIFISKKGL